LSDGFVIKGDVINQAPMKVASSKVSFLKKHFFTIVISIFVHLLLISLLLLTTKKQISQPVKITNVAIKSYLYKMPTKTVAVNPVTVTTILTEAKIIKVVEAPKKPEEKVSKKIIPKNVAENIVKEVQKNKSFESYSQMNKPDEKPSIIKRESLSTVQSAKESAPATFNSFQQLNNLRNSINNKIIEQEVLNLQKFKSPSIMHGNPDFVPHSYKKLAPEQVRENNTTNVSNDISIIKNGNGTCTIERKQFFGSPVEGSTSVFACGESKFDKNFREHMKRVRDKTLTRKEY
jgi:hypothetical protein